MCPGRRLAKRILESLPALVIALLIAVSAAAAEPAKPVAPAVAPAKAEPARSSQTEPEPIAKWIETRVRSKDKAAGILKDVVDDQDNVGVADLEDESDKNPGRRYTFFAVTLLPAWLGLAREVLTDYVVFKEIVPFVDSATYNPSTRILDLKGGVMGFTLHSFIRFTEKHERWISFEIIAGSFRGMKGDLVFESRDEKGTVVMLTGEHTASMWPPTLVMERGAEIALTVTAGKMRSYIIERKRSLFDAKAPAAGKPPKGKENDQELPQPRNRL